MCYAVSKLGCCSHKDGHSERQDGNNADNLSNAAPLLRGGHVCQMYFGEMLNVCFVCCFRQFEVQTSW